MRLLFRALILLFVTTTLSAQSDTVYLWPDQVPNEEKEKQAPVISDNTQRNVTRIAEVSNPALIVYEPKKPNTSNVGIIVCPGGGYNILAIDLEGYEVAEWLNELGYTAFVLQYRVPKNELGALNDLQRAIRYVRSSAEQYGLDTEKIGVLGFSAGGSLSARASTQFETDSYPKIDQIDQSSARPDFAVLIYPAYLDLGENRSLTPELTMSETVPPTFIFETADDPYGNSALVYAQALRDHKIPVELHFLPEGGHGYGLRPGKVAAETWPKLLEIWLDRVIHKK